MKKYKIDFLIQPSVEQSDGLTFKAVIPDLDSQTDSELFSDDVGYVQPLNSIEDPLSYERGSELILFSPLSKANADNTVPQIKGNLLANHSVGNKIQNINDHLIEDLNDAVTVEHNQGLGTLTVFTQTTQAHQAGDFIYTLHEGRSHSNDLESFDFQLQNTDGTLSSHKIIFEVSDGGLKASEPQLSQVDEEGLLPGHHELLTTYGDLNIDLADLTNPSISFSPIALQIELLNAQLSSHGVNLFYSMNEQKTKLLAYEGDQGPLVFEVNLHQDGSYSFELHSPLDRPALTNLIVDPNFNGFNQDIFPRLDAPKGWQIHQHDLVYLNDHQSSQDLTLTQTIDAQSDEPYVLTLSFGNPNGQSSHFELFWDNKLIHEFNGSQPWKVYSFALEGGFNNVSELKIIGHELTQPIIDHLHGLSLTPKSMQKLPLQFAFEVHENNQPLVQNQFMVNVNTEPTIVINTQPHEIIYENSVYQSIIVSEHSSEHSPLAILNLEPLFNKLNIKHIDREINVVQLIENGQATNTYEVIILDKAQPLTPITVADIQLTFQGGEEGLDMFYRHIQIIES